MQSPDIPTPRVTIFIPVFNAEEFLYETVSSALGQIYRDFEVLAVDDGSTDNSVLILENFNDNRLRIIKNETNMGRPYTRNRGIELAKGEYLAVLDSDDLAEPERLSRQVEFLDQHHDFAAVGSSAYYIDSSGNIVSLCEVPTEYDDIRNRIFYTNCFIHSSVMFRRQVLIDIGGYNLAFPQAQDYELFLRLCEHHPLGNIKEPLVKYRFHPNQVSQTKLASQRRLANIARLNAFKIQKKNATLPEGIIEPRINLFDRLSANEGTLGADFLGWINLYRKVGQNRNADKLILPTLLAAPLSPKIHKEIYPYLNRLRSANIIKWYINRLKKHLSAFLYFNK